MIFKMNCYKFRNIINQLPSVTEMQYALCCTNHQFSASYASTYTSDLQSMTMANYYAVLARSA